MASLIEDIRSQSDWIIKAFEADKLKLDYTIHSFINIDSFFNQHSKNGKPVKRGRLSQNLGPILFSIASYVGQTIINNIPGAKWETDDNDPEGELKASVKLPDGTVIFPIQKVMKRFQNGNEDSIYVYGYHVAKQYISEPFDESFWELTRDKKSDSKPWWKFW